MRGIKTKKTHTKEYVIMKTDGVCACCGREIRFEKITIDHYVPKYRGGTDDPRNLLPLCKLCNQREGSRIVGIDEYYPYLKSSFIIEAEAYAAELKPGI